MKRVFVDTNAFFRGKRKFLELIEKGYRLVTCIIVIYEFLKVIDELIAVEKKLDRKNLYVGLKERFPILLRELDIDIIAHKFSISDIQEALNLAKKESIDAGDL